jgi:hypothetical protein
VVKQIFQTLRELARNGMTIFWSSRMRTMR